MSKKKPLSDDNTIAINKKARFDYFIEDSFEAGLVLEGWEVKSLRAKKHPSKRKLYQHQRR